ncbi:hypothetical protein IWX84_001864 [Flavobacterium sp. CG_9.10]|uniref:DUF3871 family protein n=1 Tax=Flavobacterium sp. CG_9.10 TaxID=2787729 RepID=UPI0018CAEE19|nr:DUF3871 family protein [Flavobacterium sp. CG_9.10]MBG6110982.1 hypothetical protein [Flavobacterium sp. CG_9.10]
MNLVLNNTENQVIDETEVITAVRSNFIEANTIAVDLDHLKSECIIPVFAKDNESTISHYEFIKSTKEVVEEILDYKGVLKPEIRVSHQIKGRIPSAVAKPAKELLEHEKTLYYERMAFVIEIPEISETINGNKLCLSIGGVRSYNQENLFSKKSIEKFKVFIGFQNKVCTNLCISTDGLLHDLRVSSVLELKAKIYELINSYDKKKHLQEMNEMSGFSINETQFATLIGKMKLYSFLDKETKRNLFHLNINDNQINTIVKNYHSDPNFARFENGTIDFYRLYNLFTEAAKSAYIDTNFEKNVNAYAFINYLANFIKNEKSNWFLH